MSLTDKENWHKIDKLEEVCIVNNIKFIRPIGDNPCILSCANCNVLLSTMKDVISAKEKNICNECYEIYYYPNKEKWDKGWRPNK